MKVEKRVVLDGVKVVMADVRHEFLCGFGEGLGARDPKVSAVVWRQASQFMTADERVAMECGGRQSGQSLGDGYRRLLIFAAECRRRDLYASTL